MDRNIVAAIIIGLEVLTVLVIIFFGVVMYNAEPNNNECPYNNKNCNDCGFCGKEKK